MYIDRSQVTLKKRKTHWNDTSIYIVSMHISKNAPLNCLDAHLKRNRSHTEESCSYDAHCLQVMAVEYDARLTRLLLDTLWAILK